jgi:hypothetical protein
MSLMPQYLLPGHALRESLDRVQDRVDALHSERETLRAAPRPVTEVDAFFESQSQRFSALVFAARNALSDVDDGYASVRALYSQPLTYADIRWLLGETARNELIQRLTEIAIGSAVAPVDDAVRRQRLADLDGEIASAAHEEEHEVLALSAKGYRVQRRANVDPEMLLRTWQQAPEDHLRTGNQEGATS